MAGDDEAAHAAYRERVYVPNRSVLDLLEEFPACHLPFEVYLDLLPAAATALLLDLLVPAGRAPTPAASRPGCSAHRRGRATASFTGVCSNHLAHVPVDGTAFVFVRPPSIPFRPPENPHVPMIMVGAGTGLAPFRGFLQERAALRAAEGPDRPVAAVLRVPQRGRGPVVRRRAGARTRRRAWSGRSACFSAEPGQERRYVQQGMLDCADEVWDLLQQDAVVLVCGNASTIAPGVRASLTHDLPGPDRGRGE